MVCVQARVSSCGDIQTRTLAAPHLVVQLLLYSAKHLLLLLILSHHECDKERQYMIDVTRTK